MAKKRARKKNKPRTIIKTNKQDTNKILIENFVNLQKAITNLSVKFESLSDQTSKLLQLFEISAKSFAEKLAEGKPLDIEKDKEFLDKLNKLLDQNKTIAKGLTLMEENIRERVYGGTPRHTPRERRFHPQPSPQRQGYTPSTFESGE